jgi:hypothetical protein
VKTVDFKHLKAREIVGRCRGVWNWDGNAYTAQGVLVPPSVIATDEARYEANQDVAPDDQVLDMVVRLPKEALPEGRELVPIDPEVLAAAQSAQSAGEPAPRVHDADKAHRAELEEKDAELSALREQLKAANAELESTKADLDAATKPPEEPKAAKKK